MTGSGWVARKVAGCRFVDVVYERDRHGRGVSVTAVGAESGPDRGVVARGSEHCDHGPGGCRVARAVSRYGEPPGVWWCRLSPRIRGEFGPADRFIRHVTHQTPGRADFVHLGHVDVDVDVGVESEVGVEGVADRGDPWSMRAKYSRCSR